MSTPGPEVGVRPSAEPLGSSVRVSVIIAARNEEKNIQDAIRSVAWADQIFVVDSGSTDDTCAIAIREGAEVAQFRYDGGWPKKRNWALRTLPIRNEWVLVLDADERVSTELRDEIAATLASDSEADGYYVKWRFYFLGRWMRHSWSHGWMLRLFRHGKGEYEDLGMRGEGGWDAEVHENVVVQGQCGRLREMLDHRSEQSLTYWIRKQNEFSDWNARRRLVQLQQPIPWSHLWSGDPHRLRQLLKAIFLRLPSKPTVLFYYLYVVRMGFLDGIEGLYFCRLRAAHELNICAKVLELDGGRRG